MPPILEYRANLGSVPLQSRGSITNAPVRVASSVAPNRVFVPALPVLVFVSVHTDVPVEEVRRKPAAATNKWLEKLAGQAALHMGWDGYKAEPPSDTAIQRARTFLRALAKAEVSPSRLAPSVVGGIGITHRAGQRKVYVEFYNSGKVCALFSDGETQPVTAAIDSDNGGFRVLIEKMREYLDGTASARDASG